MDKELIKKYHLEESVKRYQQICEYTLLGDQKLNEVGKDDNMDPNAQAQQQQGMPQGGQMPQQAGQNMGQMPQQDMGQQPQMGGDMPMDQGGQGMDMGVDPNMAGDPSAMGQDAQGMGDMPPIDDPNAMGGDMGMEGDPNTDQMQPDDEVIDVDDLTQSQETTEYKIDGVNDKLTALMSVTDKFMDALEQSNAKIEALRTEIEKRNPTDTEKMNIRSQASYPYSEFPRDYWDRKLAENPHYDVTYNNDVSPADEQEFMLKSSDIKGIDDREMSKTFDYPLKLKDSLSF